MNIQMIGSYEPHVFEKFHKSDAQSAEATNSHFIKCAAVLSILADGEPRKAIALVELDSASNTIAAHLLGDSLASGPDLDDDYPPYGAGVNATASLYLTKQSSSNPVIIILPHKAASEDTFFRDLEQALNTAVNAVFSEWPFEERRPSYNSVATLVGALQFVFNGNNDIAPLPRWLNQFEKFVQFLHNKHG